MGYRIGLILGTKSTDYPRMIRFGVQNTLEERGHTLVCLADLVPYHTHAHAHSSFKVMFELARRIDLDAVIVPLGTVCGFLDNDVAYADTLLHLLDPCKTLVLEREADGYRCITKDSASGMRECIRYLIEQGHRRRIAFVSGSAASKGARDREATYFDEMAAHGLETPEGCFVRGDFSGDCHDVVERMVDAHRDIDAIACASDQMAFAVYEVLRERGIEVGRDVAVTGFDDHQDAIQQDPPLATVSMTGYDFGCMAAREALRLCEGLPQRELVQTGSFVVRESCGAQGIDGRSQAAALLAKRDFPPDEVAAFLVNGSLRMASSSLAARFRTRMEALTREVRDLYLRHLAHPDEAIELFSILRLQSVIQPEFREHFTFAGFHSAIVSLFQEAACAYPEQAAWLSAQASLMNLHVARFLSAANKFDLLGTHLREWRTLDLTEDALREDARPQEAHRLMLAGLGRIGVRWAELYMLQDPSDASGTGSLALSDTLLHVGRLEEGESRVGRTKVVSLQNLLGSALKRHEDVQLCTVGPIMAGDELMGLLVMDAGTLDDNGQMIALLNLGHALKHLQNMARIREMNEVLSRNNLLLEQQSQHDELTGLLNRRALHDGALMMLLQHPGHMATVMYLDLDGLKYINDTFGHDAGDAAIKATAKAIKEALPETYLVARLGGDEFAAFGLVADETAALDDTAAVKRTLQEANDAYHSSPASKSAPYDLVLSVGAACFASGHDCEADFAKALLQADEHMYKAKAAHRQRSSYRGRSTS